MPWPKGVPCPPERKAKVRAAMLRRIADGTWNGAAFQAASHTPEAQAKRVATDRARGNDKKKVAAMVAACAAGGEAYRAKLSAAHKARFATEEGRRQILAFARAAQAPEVNERRRKAARKWALSKQGREQKRRAGVAALRALKGASARKKFSYAGRRFRSSWEVIFVRFLRRLRVRWQYEPHAFRLDDGSFYVPDFLVFVPGREPIYVEIKGAWLGRSVDKLRRFRRTYSQVRLMVLEQDAIDSINETKKRS